MMLGIVSVLSRWRAGMFLPGESHYGISAHIKRLWIDSCVGVLAERSIEV